jgi:hypothetical protein
VNSRNLICWAAVLIGYVSLTIWGTTRPVEFQKVERSPWAEVRQAVEGIQAAQEGKEKPKKIEPPPARPRKRAKRRRTASASPCVWDVPMS